MTAPTATAGPVWMSVLRKGTDHHRITVTTKAVGALTACKRSTRTGIVLGRDEATAYGGACKRCWPGGGP